MNDWRKDLKSFFGKTEETKLREDKTEMTNFITNIAIPAFRELEAELARFGRYVNIRETVNTASITVFAQAGDEELMYRIQSRMFPNGVLPYAEIRFRERKGLRFLSIESMFRSGSQNYSLADITTDEIIKNFLEHYMKRVEKI